MLDDVCILMGLQNKIQGGEEGITKVCRFSPRAKPGDKKIIRQQKENKKTPPSSSELRRRHGVSIGQGRPCSPFLLGKCRSQRIWSVLQVHLGASSARSLCSWVAKTITKEVWLPELLTQVEPILPRCDADDTARVTFGESDAGGSLILII